MGFFDKSSSKNYSTANTAVTDNTFAPTDNRVATGGGSQFGNSSVSGGVSGPVYISQSDGSGEAIGLVSDTLDNSRAINKSLIEGAGGVVSDSFDFAGKAIAANSDGLEMAYDFGSRSLDSIDRQSGQTVDYLTSLTDNVLARDTIQKVTGQIDGSLNDVLRAVDNVGTVGSQTTTKNGITMLAVVAGAVAILYFTPQIVKSFKGK